MAWTWNAAALGTALLGIVFCFGAAQAGESAFRAEGPVLSLDRIQLVDGAGFRCEDWLRAVGTLQAHRLGVLPGADAWAQGWKSWEPWSAEDLKEVRHCERLPCLVKLNAAETASIAKFPENIRMEKYLGLVAERALNYSRTQERPGYEFPGVPLDPWRHFEAQGMGASPAKRQNPPDLWIRRLDFAPGKLKVIRQVLDRRHHLAPDGRSATLWLRDVYTNHFFDSWGEWVRFECAPDGKSGTLKHELMVELDHLKKKDLISRLARGRIRSAFAENGLKYLQQRYEAMERVAVERP